MKTLICLLFSVGLFAACTIESSIGPAPIPGSELEQLSVGQADQMKNVMLSMGDIVSVTDEYKGYSANSFRVAGKTFKINLFVSSLRQYDHEKSKWEISDKVRRAYNAGRCSVKNTLPSTSPDYGTWDVNGTFEIYGSLCPLEIDTNLGVHVESTQPDYFSQSKLDTLYKVNSQLLNSSYDIYPAVDVVSFRITGNSTVRADANKATIGDSFSIEMDSKSSGAVRATETMSSTMIPNGDNTMGIQLTLTTDVQFPGFRAVGHAVVSGTIGEDSLGKPVNTLGGTYYINGVMVSESEFKQMFGEAYITTPVL